MIIIIKINVEGKFLGIEFHEWIDESQFAANAIYDSRIIMGFTKEEKSEYECIVYTLQLSNDEVSI